MRFTIRIRTNKSGALASRLPACVIKQLVCMKQPPPLHPKTLARTSLNPVEVPDWVIVHCP
jgi:hypothetical protein